MYSRMTVVQSVIKDLCNNLFNQLLAYCNEYKIRWCSSHQSVLSETARESHKMKSLKLINSLTCRRWYSKQWSLTTDSIKDVWKKIKNWLCQ